MLHFHCLVFAISLLRSECIDRNLLLKLVLKVDVFYYYRFLCCICMQFSNLYLEINIRRFEVDNCGPS